MKKSSQFVRFMALSAMATSVIACSVFSGHETSGEYVDDTTITSKVKSQIIEDPALRGKTPQIHVETMQGVVQLSGFVDSETSKDKAAEIASHVRGVKLVKNSIVVKD